MCGNITSELPVGRVNYSSGTIIIFFFDSGIPRYKFGELFAILASAESSLVKQEHVLDIIVLAWECGSGKVALFGGSEGISPLLALSWNKLRNDFLVAAKVTIDDALEVSFWNTAERQSTAPQGWKPGAN
jgi:hypothetical protein